MPINPFFPLDPKPPWGTLNELHSLANHYIHQVSHILLSLNHVHCSLMGVNNGPPSLNPLNNKIIQWNMPTWKY